MDPRSKARKPRKGGPAPQLSHRYKYNVWVYRNFIRPANVKGMNISEYQFTSWLAPSSPTFSQPLQDSIDNKNWSRTVSIAQAIQKALISAKGIYPASEKPSNHELVIRDILYLIGHDFEYQKPYTIQDTGTQIIPDFQFSDGRIFEVFGYRSDDYRERAENKSSHLYDVLWSLNLIDHSIKSHQITLIRYARMLDSQIIFKDHHGLSLFSDSVEELLNRVVPLFLGANFKLCKNYLVQIATKSDQWTDRRRKAVDSFETMTFERPEEHSQVSNDFAFKEPLKMASAQAPSVEEIESKLSQSFLSVKDWSDEEKIAVYFKTPKALIAALGGSGTNEMKMVAHNWYDIMKLAMPQPKANKPRGVITFDFDRTLTIPHNHEGKYLYYGFEPNLPMIAKMKRYAAEGYTVGIVTSRPEEYERPGQLRDGLGKPAVAVEDFIEKYQLPVSFVRFTGWTPKGDTLMDVGSIKHHDDDPDEIDWCDDNGLDWEHVTHASDHDH